MNNYYILFMYCFINYCLRVLWGIELKTKHSFTYMVAFVTERSWLLCTLNFSMFTVIGYFLRYISICWCVSFFVILWKDVSGMTFCCFFYFCTMHLSVHCYINASFIHSFIHSFVSSSRWCVQIRFILYKVMFTVNLLQCLLQISKQTQCLVFATVSSHQFCKTLNINKAWRWNLSTIN